ncbi:MAG: response regulator transcription factor [Lachnospiraceae bacterium]|nr:response regulator transcription factor [Lachnospiraceae bacterium]
MKILFAEDDPDIRRAVAALLQKNNYTVETADNGVDALELLTEGDFDAAVLDIMMPGKNGLDVVREARKKGVRIPVMMLTAMDEIDDRINGLDAGADDYLPKPFAGGELLARLRALLRRMESFTPDVLTFKDLKLDKKGFTLSSGEKTVSLGNKAFQMMEMLMRSPGTVISAEQFMEHVWGWDTEVEINVVWVNISQLRKQLQTLGSETEIGVVRGLGYSLRKRA